SALRRGGVGSRQGSRPRLRDPRDVGTTAVLRARLVSSPILLSGGDDLGHLLHAAQRVVAAAGGQIAIIGGIAVTCRLQRAHRATEDVDAVAAERVPALLDVVSALDGVAVDAANHGRVTVEGVKVDVISVDAIDSVAGLDDKQRLFV